MRAWVFPGQGSQSLGMGAGLTSDAARETFAEAARVLGWDLLQTCVLGPEERLDSTEVTQPAVFTVGVAVARTLQARDMEPDAVAGHSVGEFAALVAAGVLRFEDALAAVAARAEAMRRAGRLHPGGMAAVVGLGLERIEELCAATPGEVGPANVNAPEQVVISGENEALAEVAAAAKSEGARVIRLKVSVAAHSALMRPARDELAGVLSGLRASAPRVPVVSGVDGRAHEDAAELVALAVEGVTHAVRWIDCVRTLEAMGVDTFVEVGPGRVLSGLIRRIAPVANTLQVADDEAVNALLDGPPVVVGGGHGHVG
ncbi:MAG: ACP S-malonyltransferase [Actinomycetota bacterium]